MDSLDYRPRQFSQTQRRACGDRRKIRVESDQFGAMVHDDHGDQEVHRTRVNAARLTVSSEIDGLLPQVVRRGEPGKSSDEPLELAIVRISGMVEDFEPDRFWDGRLRMQNQWRNELLEGYRRPAASEIDPKVGIDQRSTVIFTLVIVSYPVSSSNRVRPLAFRRRRSQRCSQKKLKTGMHTCP